MSLAGSWRAATGRGRKKRPRWKNHDITGARELQNRKRSGRGCCLSSAGQRTAPVTICHSEAHQDAAVRKRLDTPWSLLNGTAAQLLLRTQAAQAVLTVLMER
jgi:hypothetical protein